MIILKVVRVSDIVILLVFTSNISNRGLLLNNQSNILNNKNLSNLTTQ